MKNHYIPQLSTIKEVIKHTDLEYTFRMEFDGEAKPGQFFEVSIPKYGEAPISVSGIGDGLVDFTIRRVGKVTNEIFENYVGDSFFIRGPYGNGFDIENYKNRELTVEELRFLYEVDEEIIGYQKQKSLMFNNNYSLFEVIEGIGENIKTAKEGVHYKNFYGTYLSGPFLIRNPFFTIFVLKKLILYKDQTFTFKPFDLQLEKEAYFSYLNYNHGIIKAN